MFVAMEGARMESDVTDACDAVGAGVAILEAVMSAAPAIVAASVATVAASAWMVAGFVGWWPVKIGGIWRLSGAGLVCR
jgi:hypothetical protein